MPLPATVVDLVAGDLADPEVAEVGQVDVAVGRADIACGCG
jgi:hypothetical protein